MWSLTFCFENSKSRVRRCAMLALSPVTRLSMPTTEKPMPRSVSARCEPRKPAAPVITTRPLPLALGPLPSLVGMLVEEAFDDRQPDDLEVEAHRPVLDVIKVVFDALLERGVAAPAVDLRPARHAGL